MAKRKNKKVAEVSSKVEEAIAFTAACVSFF